MNWLIIQLIFWLIFIFISSWVLLMIYGPIKNHTPMYFDPSPASQWRNRSKKLERKWVTKALTRFRQFTDKCIIYIHTHYILFIFLIITHNYILKHSTVYKSNYDSYITLGVLYALHLSSFVFVKIWINKHNMY